MPLSVNFSVLEYQSFKKNIHSIFIQELNFDRINCFGCINKKNFLLQSSFEKSDSYIETEVKYKIITQLKFGFNSKFYGNWSTGFIIQTDRETDKVSND